MTHPYIKADGNVEIQLILYKNFIFRLRDTIEFLDDCQTIAKDVNEDTIEGCTSSNFYEIKQFFEKLDVKEFLQYLHKRILDKKEYKLTHDKWKKGRIYYLLKDWSGEPQTSQHEYYQWGFQKIEDCYNNSVSNFIEERFDNEFEEEFQGCREVEDVPPQWFEDENEKNYLGMSHRDDFGALSDEEILIKRNKELEHYITDLLNQTDYKEVQALKATLKNAHKAAESKGFTFETVDEVEYDPDDDLPF